MKILIVCQHYYPEQFLLNDIATELVRRGNDVTVLAGLPNYPEGKVLSEYRWGRRRSQIIDGVKVIRCFEIGRGRGYFQLGVNYLSYSISASIKSLFLKGNFDIVFSYQLSPISMAFPAILYKKRKKVPVFLYCCDLWPESLKGHVKKPSGFFYKTLARFSRYVYNAVDVVTVASKPFIEYMQKVNEVPASVLRYRPQYASGYLMKEDLTAEDNGIVDFMFAGNFGYDQDLDVIIKAAGALRERSDFRVHLVGFGARLEALKELVKKEKLEDKVTFHGRVPFDEMGKFYKKADALLITLRCINEIGKTMPTKLETYMTTGKPIFGAINGAAEEVIRESDCGRTVRAGDYMGLANLMKDYIEHPENYIHCGENAKQYFADNFTLEGHVDWLEGEFRQLAGMVR
ncbi:MAG: glycosyltransferase family 4 protein [Thermoguttaceae bacterium]|nr:glycosyltransferase family 4 protein [Thermoguttaceae bacterium]